MLRKPNTWSASLVISLESMLPEVGFFSTWVSAISSYFVTLPFAAADELDVEELAALPLEDELAEPDEEPGSSM